MITELLKILAITAILVVGISIITIPLAFLLNWLDEKGVIKKITDLFKKGK